MTIDKLETKLDKINETLRGLSFSFVDPDLSSEAETLRDEAVAALEAYLELAVQDWENRPDSGHGDEDDESC